MHQSRNRSENYDNVFLNVFKQNVFEIEVNGTVENALKL